MIVLDASVLAEYLVGSQVGRLAAVRLVGLTGGVHVPHLAISETAAVLRSWVARGEILAERARGALEDLADLPAARYPVEPFLPRIWELRHNLSAYDAHYVALAESLGAGLLTLDGRIARASGHSASVEVLAAR